MDRRFFLASIVTALARPSVVLSAPVEYEFVLQGFDHDCNSMLAISTVHRGEQIRLGLALNCPYNAIPEGVLERARAHLVEQIEHNKDAILEKHLRERDLPLKCEIRDV